MTSFRKLLAVLCLLPIFMCFTFTNRLNESTYRLSAEPLKNAPSSVQLRAAYDVIVVGTDPEGIMAAISAARNGLRVLLVEHRDRDAFGGLMTLGWLNSLDLNKSPTTYRFWNKPVFLNGGLFQEWFNGIGGTSFDVNRAANLFRSMVMAEPNIDVLMHVRDMAPVKSGSTVSGLRIVDHDGVEWNVAAKAVIDATQDADVAAAAGAPYTIGREDLGEPNVRMAVTLVIKLSGVTDKRWKTLQHHKNTGFDDRSIWGYQEAREYVSSRPDRVKIRSLNMGRQDGDTLLINSMQIYGVDPLDPASVEEGMRIGEAEAPRIVEYLKTRFAEFRDLEFAGTAPELYVRESRHMLGEYRLTMADLMENRDHWDAIAYGAYEVDIQSVNALSAGAIMMKPRQYGVPFRCLVPLKIDGLLVVGRSSSFDSLPHGSARVIPLGMATGEAAGTAVRLAMDRGITLRELSQSKADIAELRRRLKKQGMDLRMRSFETPAYLKHKSYSGLLAAASLSLTIGGYTNDGWALDKPSNPKRFTNIVRTVRKIYPALQSAGSNGEAIKQDVGQKLSLKQAAEIIAVAAGIQGEREDPIRLLLDRGWLAEETVKGFANPDSLTNGDTYMLIRDLVKNAAGVTFG